MTDDFDPYHRWLGIPPKYQPADHYRLLGLERFEDDAEVIVDAAERQMAHVRRYALGPNQVLSQTILNELAAAQACLMDPVQKARYDEDLRQRQTPATPRTAPSPPVPTPVIPETPITPAAAPTAPRPVKLHDTARPRPAVRKPVAAVPKVVRPQTPEQLSLWRYLVIGVPLLLVLAGLLVAFGWVANRRPASTIADSAVSSPAVEPAPQPVLERDPEPVPQPSPPTRPLSLLPLPDQIIDEGVEFRVRVEVDSDEPFEGLRFHLHPGFPAGMAFDEPQRTVIWTPDESQGPGEYDAITIVAAIPGPPSQEVRESFRIRVREVNSAPSIAPIADQVAEAGQEVVVVIAVRDDDLPANELTLHLLDGPPGAVIDTGRRRFTWTPAESHAGRAWPVTVVVRDNGQPPMAAETGFTVRVTPAPKLEPTMPKLPPPAAAPFDAAQAKARQAASAAQLRRPEEVTNSIGMKMMLIPPGEFLMGSPDDELGRAENETQHPVRITRPFYLGVYEVTQAEYLQVMGRNPSSFSSFSSTGTSRRQVLNRDTSRFPVETVSWEDATEFCRRLSALPAEKASARVYRLPTEAEWEYACRADSKTKWSFGNSESSLGDYAWYTSNAGRKTNPVGQKKPNAWGLYDMHGNVWEWCSDWLGDYASTTVSDPTGPAAGSLRVNRGGSWHSTARLCRSAARAGLQPSFRVNDLGFRLAFSSVDQSGR
jgi:formylglycine-generating enzyme required for sulfatase activity